jgi:hypothetical protein
MTSTQYRHQNGISNIWPSPYTVGWFRWSNARGEGEAPSFDEAVSEAEEALTPCVPMTTTEAVESTVNLIVRSMIRNTSQK